MLIAIYKKRKKKKKWRMEIYVLPPSRNICTSRFGRANQGVREITKMPLQISAAILPSVTRPTTPSLSRTALFLFPPARTRVAVAPAGQS